MHFAPLFLCGICFSPLKLSITLAGPYTHSFCVSKPLFSLFFWISQLLSYREDLIILVPYCMFRIAECIHLCPLTWREMSASVIFFLPVGRFIQALSLFFFYLLLKTNPQLCVFACWYQNRLGFCLLLFIWCLNVASVWDCDDLRENKFQWHSSPV